MTLRETIYELKCMKAGCDFEDEDMRDAIEALDTAIRIIRPFTEDAGKTVEVKKGLYRHFKGEYYTVLDVATHTETGEKLVIYRKTYGEVGKQTVWARPADMFTEEVDGVPRFKFLG